MRWLCIPIVLALSGCVSWSDIPDDLRFITLHNNIDPYPHKERGEYVGVEVETNLNYINYEFSRDVYVRFFFCGHQDKNVEGLGGGDLYNNMGKWIGQGGVTHDDSSPPYRYNAVFFTSHHHYSFEVPGKYHIVDYDLREEPRDLCFYLDAGPYYQEKSNIVRIPKEELIKFFAEHPRPKTGATQ